jgi:hypothetical protein
MDGRCGTDAERWKMPKFLRLSWSEYTRQPRVDRYYSLVERGDMAVLRLDYPPPGLSNDPRDIQLMLDMHLDSLMRQGPFLSP